MRRGIKVGQGKDALAGFDAVKTRHLPVDEGNVVRLAGLRRLLDHFDAFVPRRRFIGDEAQIGQHAGQHAARLSIVVDDQHAPPVQV